MDGNALLKGRNGFGHFISCVAYVNGDGEKPILCFPQCEAISFLLCCRLPQCLAEYSHFSNLLSNSPLY